MNRELHLPRCWVSAPGPPPGRQDLGRGGVRDQVRAGPADDHPGAGCRGCPRPGSPV